MLLRGFRPALARSVLTINLFAALLVVPVAARADGASEARRVIELQYAILDKGMDHGEKAQALHSLMANSRGQYEGDLRNHSNPAYISTIERIPLAERESQFAKMDADLAQAAIKADEADAKVHIKISESTSTILTFQYVVGEFVGTTVMNRFKITSTDPKTGRQDTKIGRIVWRDLWYKVGGKWSKGIYSGGTWKLLGRNMQQSFAPV